VFLLGRVARCYSKRPDVANPARAAAGLTARPACFQAAACRGSCGGVVAFHRRRAWATSTEGARVRRVPYSRMALETRPGPVLSRVYGATRTCHVLLGLALVGAGLLIAESAQGSCAAPSSAILWSYPADGETEVPTNVVLWALPVGVDVLEVSLNGSVVLPGTAPFSYDLGALAPNTVYTLAFDFSGRFGDAHIEQTFSTGNGPAELQPGAAPGTVTPSRWAYSDFALSDFCDQVLWAQGCFDTGQDTHFLFAPSGSAQAWLVQEDRVNGGAPLLWPAECGAPDFFSDAFARPCVTLTGIDQIGALHEGQSVCAPAAVAAEPAEDSDDTSTRSPPPVAPAAGPAMGEASPVDVAPVAATPSAPRTRAGGCSLPTSRRSSSAPLAAALSLLALAALRRRPRASFPS